LRKKKEENRLSRDKLQRNIDNFKSNVDKILKKIKNLKKKLREISDIQIKVDLKVISLSNEQRDKLDRKQEIEDDITELNEELDILESNEPPPIPDYLLELDNDIITDISSSPIEVKNEVILTFAERLRLENNSQIKSNSKTSNNVYVPPRPIDTKSRNSIISNSSKKLPLTNKIINISALSPSSSDDVWESVSIGKKKKKI
jgi:hypothetical protein